MELPRLETLPHEIQVALVVYHTPRFPIAILPRQGTVLLNREEGLTLRQAQPIPKVGSGASTLGNRWSGHEAAPDRPPSVGVSLQL